MSAREGKLKPKKMSKRKQAVVKSAIKYERERKQRSPATIASEKFERIIKTLGVDAAQAAYYKQEVEGLENSRFMNMVVLANAYKIMIELQIDKQIDNDKLGSYLQSENFNRVVSYIVEKVLENRKIKMEVSDFDLLFLEFQREIIRYITYVVFSRQETDLINAGKEVILLQDYDIEQDIDQLIDVNDEYEMDANRLVGDDF